MSAFFLRHPRETDLALFAGGELGPFSRWRIERHLEICSACEATVSDYFRLGSELSVLAELPEVDWNSLAVSIENRAAAARSAERRRPAIAWPNWRVAIAGVGVACALLLAVQSWDSSKPAPAVSTTAVEKVASSLEIAPKADLAVKEETETVSQPELALASEPSPSAEPDRGFLDVGPPAAQPPLAADVIAPSPPPAPAVKAAGGFQADFRTSASMPALQPRIVLPNGSLSQPIEFGSNGRMRLRTLDAETGIVTFTEVHAQ